MPSTVATAARRTPPNPVRESFADLKARAIKIRPDSVGVRDGSEPIRIDPNLAHKAEFLALVDEARIRAGMSQKEMSINAGVPEGTFSEALKGTRGNFAIHWLDRQPAKYWLAFNHITADRYGLSPAKQDDVWAERIGELVTLLIKNRRLS